MIDMKKKYAKKLLIENELSTPEARAERLKRIRNLANLTRKEICDSSGININTYKGWELARFGGLPVDGAEKIILKVGRSGVICSSEWLLYGKSPSPSLAPEGVLLNKGGEDTKIIKPSLIEQEFSIYQKNTKNAILEEVNDDSVLPNIKKGDFLAGVMKFGEDINLILNQLCIVQTIGGKKLIRYVKKGGANDVYTLIAENPLSDAADLSVLNTKLLYAAPISRHYIINALKEPYNETKE